MQQKREAFLADMAGVNPKRVFFLDEFGFNLGFCREWGWSVRGKRAYGSKPENPGPNVTLIVGLRYSGAVEPFTFVGAMDGPTFTAYVTKRLGPHLRPGSIVVVDGLGAHRAKAAAEALAKRGVRLQMLSPYSPDRNPVEECGSKLKASVRGEAPRTQAALEESLGRAYGKVTAKDARGWFRDRANYLFPPKPG